MRWLRYLTALSLGVLVGAAGMHWLGAPADMEPPPASASQRPDAAPPTEPISPSPSVSSSSLSRHPHPDLRDAIADLEDHPHPLLRAAALTQLGYEAAGRDLEGALMKVDAIADASGKRAFIKGLFTRVAEDKPPYQAIQRVRRLGRAWETEGFKALVSQWSGQELDGEVSFQEIYRRLLSSPETSPEIKQAWMQSYQGHSARSDMLAEFGASFVDTAPEDALALGSHLKGWESQEFQSQLVQRWMRSDPEAAWKWAQAHRKTLDAESIPAALMSWAESDRQAALRAFEELTDPSDRLASAAALATQFATSQGTRASLDWADGLSTIEEQDAAHEAIYEATPRGIGAVLDQEEGTLTVRDLLPGSPSLQAGLRKGDRIVEVDPGQGSFQPLSSSQNIQEAVNLIRGEPGSALRLRVLRTDGSVDVLDLNRQQLVFDAPSPPPRAALPESN